MTDIGVRVAILRNRLAARLPQVTGLELHQKADVWTLSGETPTGRLVITAGAHHGTDDELMSNLLAACTASELVVLPEIVLRSDVAVTLGPWTLRIAESQTAASSSPAPGRAAGTYSAEQAEADIARMAAVGMSRADASFMLSKLHGWMAGARGSEGEAYARQVWESAVIARTPEEEAYRVSKLGDQNLPPAGMWRGWQDQLAEAVRQAGPGGEITAALQALVDAPLVPDPDLRSTTVHESFLERLWFTSTVDGASTTTEVPIGTPGPKLGQTLSAWERLDSVDSDVAYRWVVPRPPAGSSFDDLWEAMVRRDDDGWWYSTHTLGGEFVDTEAEARELADAELRKQGWVLAPPRPEDARDPVERLEAVMWYGDGPTPAADQVQDPETQP